MIKLLKHALITPSIAVLALNAVAQTAAQPKLIE